MKRFFMVTTLVVFPGIFDMGPPQPCQAYIMPAEQIIGLMMKNFTGLDELTLVQNVHCARTDIENPSDAPLQQRLLLKSPGRYALETLESSSESDGEKAAGSAVYPVDDIIYRPLLMPNTVFFIMSLLSEMGVHLDAVRLTRFHGIIAYQIGEDDGSSILVDKDHFLPLAVNYCLAGHDGPKAISVQFQDYRNTGKASYYPHTIIYEYGDRQIDRYTVISLNHRSRITSPLVQIKTHNLLSARACDRERSTPQSARETPHREPYKIHRRTSE